MAPAKSARNCSRYDLDAGKLTKTSMAINRLFCLDAHVLLAELLSYLLMIDVALLFVVAFFDGCFTSIYFVVIKSSWSIIISSDGTPIVFSASSATTL